MNCDKTGNFGFSVKVFWDGEHVILLSNCFVLLCFLSSLMNTIYGFFFALSTKYKLYISVISFFVVLKELHKLQNISIIQKVKKLVF